MKPDIKVKWTQGPLPVMVADAHYPCEYRLLSRESTAICISPQRLTEYLADWLPSGDTFAWYGMSVKGKYDHIDQFLFKFHKYGYIQAYVCPTVVSGHGDPFLGQVSRLGEFKDEASWLAFCRKFPGQSLPPWFSYSPGDKSYYYAEYVDVKSEEDLLIKRIYQEALMKTFTSQKSIDGHQISKIKRLSL
jgi:hypothetical protein